MPSDIATAHLSVAGEVAATDEQYFALGADRLTVGSLALYVHRRFTDVPAGVVAVGVDPGPDDDHDHAADGTLDALVRTVDDLGVRQVRVYASRGQEADRRALTGCLARRSARRSTEVLLAARPGAIAPPGRPIELEPIVDDAGWEAKRAVQRADAASPDGHLVDPDRWHAFERDKAQDPSFAPMVVRAEDEVVGSVSLLAAPSIVRVKNLVVSPAWRRQGMAGEILRAIAARHPEATLGVMAVAGSHGLRAYLRAGADEVGRVDEWTLLLSR